MNKNPTMPSSIKTAAALIKIQEGRIGKPRGRKGEAKTPNYSIDGRTFACESCKKGHRVSKCTHALQRPVHMTNDPGRPSADQRRHCDCPRQCSCTKKNCKCDRNCNCIQRMYMLVYIPFEKTSKDTKTREGEWRIDREVITDLKGNRLSDEEIQKRKEKKRGQPGHEVDTAFSREESHNSTDSESDPKFRETLALTISETTSNVVPSCCKHKATLGITTKVKDQADPVPNSLSTRPQCNCGTSCACAFCLDHPNNNVSQKIAQRQAAAFFADQDIVAREDQKDLNLWNASTGSCMGTSPQFAMLSNPNPSSSELLELFGPGTSSRNGYFLSYPLTRPAALQSDLFATNQVADAQEVSTSLLDYSTNKHALCFSPLPPALALETSYTPSLGPIQPNLSGASLGHPGNWGIGDASTSNLMDMSEDPFLDLKWLNPVEDEDAWLTANTLVGSTQPGAGVTGLKDYQQESMSVLTHESAFDVSVYKPEAMFVNPYPDIIIEKRPQPEDHAITNLNVSSLKSEPISRSCSSNSHEYNAHSHPRPTHPHSLLRPPPLF